MSAGPTNLVLSYVFDGSELAPKNYERDPSLLFWTSNNRRWSQTVAVQWKHSDSDPTESVRHTISVPIDTSSLYLDDAIRTACFVLSPNHDKRLVRSKAGSGGIYISKLIREQLKNPSRPLEFSMDLTMQNFQPNGEPFLKGRVSFRVENHLELSKKQWKFTNSTIGLMPENRPVLEKTIMYGILRTVYPYDQDNARQHSLYFPPSHPTVDRIHAPLWTNEVGTVPGMYYWVDYTNNPPDENFYSNLARIALERKNISAHDYIAAVDKQFETNSEQLSNEFFDAVVTLSDMCSIVSTSLPYKGDNAYTGKRSMKSRPIAGEEISIESFHDALRMLGGDCEDLGNLIYRIFTALDVGRPELSNKADHWTKYGAWKNPVLQRMQKIARLYVCTGSLGSVVGAYLGQKEKMSQPPVIHSKRDDDIELGAHMWCEQMPLAIFEEKLSKANAGKQFRLFPDAPRFAWEHKLPHMIGEGTGYLSPLLKPISDYFPHDKEHQKTMVNMYKTKLECMTHLARNTTTLIKGTMQRVQTMLEHMHDVRMNTFFREAVHCYTDKFMREGYNYGEFTWTYTSPRVVESTGKPESNAKGWAWGVSMRDRLYNKPNLALCVTPGYTEEEFHVVKSHLRHMPPQSNPTLELSKDATERLGKLCDRYQVSLNAITSSRTASGTSTMLNVIFKEADFSEATFHDQILKEIQKLEDIYRVRISPEFITADIVNVRLDVWMNTPTQVKEEQVLKAPQMQRSKSVEFYAQCPALSFKGYGNFYSVIVEWADKANEANKFTGFYAFDTRAEAEDFSEGLQIQPPQGPAQYSEAMNRGLWVQALHKDHDALDVKISQIADPMETRVSVRSMLIEGRRSDRLRDHWLDPRQEKIDKFKQKNRGWAAVLLVWEGLGQGDEETYSSHKYRTNEEVDAFLRGLTDGNMSKGDNSDKEKSSLQQAYRDGFERGEKGLEDEMFSSIVARRRI